MNDNSLLSKYRYFYSIGYEAPYLSENRELAFLMEVLTEKDRPTNIVRRRIISAEDFSKVLESAPAAVDMFRSMHEKGVFDSIKLPQNLSKYL